MNKGILWAVAVPLMWLSAVLDQGAAPHMTLLNARPSFLLVSTVVLALFSRPAGGAFSGFVAAILQGVISGANLASYVVSRVLSGFLASASRMLGLETSSVVVLGTTVVTTIVAQIILMFFAPPPRLLTFAEATIIEAIYNGVLAVPLFAIIRRLVGVSAHYY